ncbi:hypothetical protein CsSME_00001452 [Camellia sinensis var. sinensis]
MQCSSLPDAISAVDFVTNRGACNALLGELCAQDRVLEALQYFSGVSDAGSLLGYWCYNMLVDGLCLKGHLNEAIEGGLKRPSC